jgi:hypothetical protein
MRSSTLLLFGAIASIIVFALARAPTSPEPQGDTVDQSVNAGARRDPLDDRASGVSQARAAPGLDVAVAGPSGSALSKAPAEPHADQPPSFIVLDASEPDERVDVGSPRNVDLHIEHSRSSTQLLGGLFDADEPGTYPVPADRARDIGDPRNADTIAQNSDVDTDAKPLAIGDELDADPLADALWQAERRAGSEVQDLGPPRPIPDESTDPWTLFLEPDGY